MTWETTTIQPLQGHNSTLIWFHGLGDSGPGWTSSIEHMQKQLPNTKFLMPSAAPRALAIYPGATTPAWFQVLSLHPNGAQDAPSLSAAYDQAMHLVRKECESLPSEQVYVGGFCIGGALAAHVALRTELELGGLIVLSGWIPQMSSYPSALSKHRPDVFWCHADEDATILFGFATMFVKALQSWSHHTELEPIHGGHSINKEELSLVAAWMQDRVCDFTPAAMCPDADLDQYAAPSEEPSADMLQAATQKKISASEAMCSGDIVAAVSLFTEAINLAGSSASPLVYANRAVALMRLTPPKVKAAIQDCTQALLLNPDSAKALKTRGKAYTLLGQWEEAVKDLRIGQQIDYDEASAEVAREAEKKFAEEGSSNPKQEQQPPPPAPPAKPTPDPAASSEANNPAPLPAEFMQNLLGDPELMSAMQNPEIAPKLQDIVTAVMSNPMQAMGTVMEYVNDPKLGPLIMKLMGKFETKTKWTSIDEVD